MVLPFADFIFINFKYLPMLLSRLPPRQPIPRPASLARKCGWRAFKLMFYLRHDQAPCKKHGIEDTPREHTRDASYIFGSLLKNWSFFK